MSTPNGTRVVARSAEGADVDVTEGVQALYDHCVQSMDWGSGFLTIEDARGIIAIAQTCGFLMPEGAAAEFEQYARHLPGQNNIICATCGEPVRYEFASPSVGRGAGWRHVDHDPGHPVVLWR